MTFEQKLDLVYTIFSPSSPIENPEMFIGRITEIEKIRDTIEERGQHAIMYGKRGVGKTSVANMVSNIFKNVIISKITCNRNDTYYSLWDKALRNIKFTGSEKMIGYTAKMQQYETSLRLPDKKKADAHTIEKILRDIPDYSLFIFDEFDTIQDAKSRMQMADTIKNLSDNVPNVTILLVGIADNITELIGQHPSIERCIKQIHIPLMSFENAIDIIENGMGILKMEIMPDIASKIALYASGYPHYIHQLCKFASKEAIYAKSNKVTNVHFNSAVQLSIENSDHSLNQAFEAAVAASSAHNQFKHVIIASTLVDTDHNDTFSPEQVIEVFNTITQKNLKLESINYNLGMLCKTERGDILQKTGNARNRRYKFRNPLMKAFIKLKLHE